MINAGCDYGSCHARTNYGCLRIAHNSLAVRANLTRRGMVLEDTRCLLCQRSNEDGCHLFLKCKEVKEVWKELNMLDIRHNLIQSDGVHEVLDELWRINEPKRVEIIAMWWNRWNQRNNVCEGRGRLAASEVAHRARCLAAGSLQFCKPVRQRAICSPGKWEPPEADLLKFNVDGAYKTGDRQAGWGVVAHDADGQVISTVAGCSDGIQDAFMTELKALEAAINLASSLGAIRVVFETDAQMLMYEMNNTAIDLSPAAAIIEDLKYQCRNWFSKCSIISCKREVNGVAHELAKIGASCAHGFMNV